MDEAVVFVAFVLGGAVHAAAGFGSALVGMPILTLAIAPAVAAPLQNAVGLLLSAQIWYHHRERWLWRDSLALILFSLTGIPFGTYALTHLPEAFVLGVLGAVLLAYAAYEMIGAPGSGDGGEGNVRGDPAYVGASVAGLLAGILGAAYAANGPPAIVYGRLRRWPRAEFKSILQSLFLVNGAAVLAWQGAAGLLTNEVARQSLFALPGLAVGAAIGYRIDKRLDHEQFRIMVLGLIAVLGAAMVVRACL